MTLATKQQNQMSLPSLAQLSAYGVINSFSEIDAANFGIERRVERHNMMLANIARGYSCNSQNSHQQYAWL